LKITLVVAFGVGTFGGDLGSLLVKQDFTSYFYLIPLITIGYVFYQLSFIYIRSFGYAKKTIFLSLSFILSGLSNVIFTYFLGNIYGVLGVSISFVISYLILLVITWSINEYFLKLYSTSWVKLIKPLVVVIPFYFILLVVGFMDDIFLIFGLKVLSFILLSVLLLGNDLKLAFVVLQAKYYKS
jgi:O-antigen/teichoic acid export membrane protein